MKEIQINNENYNKKSKRTGIFTTGIVSVINKIKIALYFTGRNHSGENMEILLKERAKGKSPPLQMCDALSRNMSGEFVTILCNCLAHARRKFVEIVHNFTEECLYVIRILKDVYHYDKIARDEKMSPSERLAFHQKNSAPLMDELKQWIEYQFKENNVEPNGSLGGALQYFLNHWKELTMFLQVENAPLDNNICEQALKKAILHRKNAYFFKTETGALMGDICMSIIETCRLNNINPFDYLVAVQKYNAVVQNDIDGWMPWNYQKSAAYMSG